MFLARHYGQITLFELTIIYETCRLYLQYLGLIKSLFFFQYQLYYSFGWSRILLFFFLFQSLNISSQIFVLLLLVQYSGLLICVNIHLQIFNYCSATLVRLQSYQSTKNTRIICHKTVWILLVLSNPS